MGEGPRLLKEKEAEGQTLVLLDYGYHMTRYDELLGTPCDQLLRMPCDQPP